MILAAQGEKLPLESGIADLVLSDNVLDHVEIPDGYLGECRRILKPGGTFFFTVDVHHPIWHRGAGLYNRMFQFGFRTTVPAFPNHPFHFSDSQAGTLLGKAGFLELHRWGGQANIEIKDLGPRLRTSMRALFRGGKIEGVIKQVFFKNIRLEIVASRE